MAAVGAPRARPVAAIVCGGVVAGTLDLLYVIPAVSLRGMAPIRLPQHIASGLLGARAYSGGWATAALGVGLEFVITFGAATVYYAASRRMTVLVERPAAWGMAYGAAIYAFMHLVVLPMSAATPTAFSLPFAAADFVVHLLFIGLPIALAARRFS